MATPTFAIFVKWIDNKTTTIDGLLPVSTIAEVKGRLLEKLGIHGADPRRFTLSFNGKWLDDTATLEGKGIEKDQTLHTILRPVQEDAQDGEVLEVLRRHLREIAEDRDGKRFVFIGIASYVGAESHAPVKRQQCPETMWRWCQENEWDLRVLLIDPDFPVEEGGPPQIYDMDDQGWIAKPVSTEADGKVRHYGNLTSKGHLVTTYRTGIPEYSYGNNLTSRTTVGGVALNQIAAGWANVLDTHCLVSGNFFEESPARDQYITIGDPGVLAHCGFSPNH